MKQANTLLLDLNPQGVAIITLNRPEVHNAFDDELIAHMTDALQKFAVDPKVKVLMLKSAGKHFCAGADLSWMQKMARFDEQANVQDAQALAELMFALHYFPKPTLALVQGNAYGGGAGLIACCHIVIAAATSQFCFSEAKLGLIPAVISPYVVQAIGQRQARAYFLSAKLFNADCALRMGLCHEVVASDKLQDAGEEMIACLLRNGPQALQEVNQLINKLQSPHIDKDLIAWTAQTIAHLRVSAEGQEGLNAFLEKREPAWITK